MESEIKSGLPIVKKSTVPTENFYFCPRCCKVPNMKIIDNSMVEIHCSCFEKNEMKTYEEIKNLTELTKYRIYKIPLDIFNKEIEKKQPLQKCAMKDRHSETESEAYCVQCRKPFCSKCLTEHNKFCDNHFITKCKEVVIQQCCENPNCKNKSEIVYYCKQCRIHLCEACGNNHQSSHMLLDLSAFLREDYLNKFKEQLETLENIIHFYRSLLSSYTIY